METIIPVFQFEIRYIHILNFSQIARDLLAPYVKLTQSIKIDKQNTVEETYFLNFEDDGYVIIISWDRIVFKGQGNLDTYINKNSPFNTLFFDIFNQIRELKEFGVIQKSLFYGISISKQITADSLLNTFIKKTLSFNPIEINKDINDIAIVLESTTDLDSRSITFGPYWGIKDISKRAITPVDIASLGDIEFNGVMLEYKHIKVVSEINYNDFVEYCSEFKNTFKLLWQNR